MSLRRAAGDRNTSLELLYYRNRFQLVTTDALYSDGDRYAPAVATVQYFKGRLPGIKKVLSLGTGIGSIMHVMQAQGYAPYFTLVEHDKTVLNWAIELMSDADASRVEPVCSDAKLFMEKNERKYDLIFIDIFTGMVVPEFVTTQDFLQQCRDSLTPEGCLAFNYIIPDKEEWARVLETFTSIFPERHVIKNGINRILVNTKI